MTNDLESIKSPQIIWDKDIRVTKRIRENTYYSKKGVGKKRVERLGTHHLIKQDSPINHGISVGENPRCAIVVDDSQDKILRSTLAVFKKEYEEELKKASTPEVLQLVYDLIEQKIPRNIESIDIATEKTGPDGGIYLGAFIGYTKGGTCLARSLFGAYILEDLIEVGLLNGNVSVDRNTVEDKGSHAWVRYEDFATKKVHIIDNNKGYNWSLDDLQATDWPYKRPTDK